MQNGHKLHADCLKLDFEATDHTGPISIVPKDLRTLIHAVK